jgi:hypothetical protein
MSNYRVFSFVILTLFAVLALVPPPAAAQAIPRGSDGKPDFSGVWEQPIKVNTRGPRGGPGGRTFDAEKMAPFKPGGEALLYQMRTGDVRIDEPRSYCLPSGFPSGMLQQYPIHIVQNAGYMVMVHEFQRATRIIPMDGRPHRTELEPSFYGDSIGKWEGDTLVIDTTNLRRWILDDFHYIDEKKGRWHTDALHVIERMQFKDRNTVSYTMTIDDPKIFTAPWTQEFEMKFHPEWEKTGILEYVCEENNRCPGGDCIK